MVRQDTIPGGQTDALDAREEQEKAEDLRETLKGAIKVDVTDVGVLRKIVDVKVPRANIDAELDKEYAGIISEAVVPGFRRGRAPRRLVEKRYGSEVGSQVQARLVSNAYLAAVDKAELKVLGDPLVWVKYRDKKNKEAPAEDRLLDISAALEHMKLPEEGDLEFRCEVEVKPAFDLPNLDGIEIEKPQVSITDEDVQFQIDRLRALRGSWAPVPNGTVEIDDLLVCDVRVTADGEEVRRAENVTVAARPQRLEGIVFEDLGERVKGARVGDTRTLEGVFPEDHESENLRGQRAGIELKINDIKRMDLPPLDGGFLESQGFETESELRQHIRRTMESQLDQEIRRGMRNQVRRYLIENTKLELPEGLSARQTDRAVFRRAVELQRQGVPPAEIEKHADELRTSARDEAVAELRLHFILEAIAEKLEIDVSEEEINSQIAAIARLYNRRFDRVRDDLARSGGIESLYLQIRDDKCVDHILRSARIVDKPVERKPAPKAGKPEKAEKAGKAEKRETAIRPPRKAEGKPPAAKAEKPRSPRSPTKKKP